MKLPAHILLSVIGLLLLATGCLGGRNSEVDMKLLLDELSPEADMSRGSSHSWDIKTSSGKISAEASQAVLLDVKGPGVITRMQLSATDRRGRLRFFFDGASSAAIEIASFSAKIPDIPEGLYDGEAASWAPIPFSRQCRIVYEAPAAQEERAPKTFHIDYRIYSSRTRVETFSARTMASSRKKLQRIAQLLQAPEARPDTQRIESTVVLRSGDPVVINLPAGPFAVSELNVSVAPINGNYEQSMRDIIVQTIFDGLHTMRLPLSDFSGGGMGARAVQSHMISADGKGSVTSRWIMPYQEVASIAFINEGLSRVRVSYSVSIVPIAWEAGRTLYFNASWREILSGETDSVLLDVRGGKGVLKGEAYTLYNYGSASDWLSEGIIEAASDGVRLFEAKGLDNYFNIPTDGPSVKQTPFGGMIRAGAQNTFGYNSLLRLRGLDDIVFDNNLRITYRKPSGRIDFAAVAYWYGDNKARAAGFTAPVFQSRILLPAPSEEGEGDDRL